MTRIRRLPAGVVAALMIACGERAPAPATGRSLAQDSSRATTANPRDAMNADSLSAVGLIRQYYAAIAARRFRRAYELWGNDGASSGKSFADFVTGFGNTARVGVDVGTPSRVEGAAGSRYIDVPVEIRAMTRDSTEQGFQGTYTLRRSVVDGATSSQRRWHIYSATITQTH